MPCILHIEAGKNLYGGALQVIYLIQGLNRQGNYKNILVCTKNSAYHRYAEKQGIECAAIEMKGDLDLFMIRRIRKLIQYHKPSLIHLHSRRGADLFGAIAGRMEHLPVLLTRRVDNPEPRFWVQNKYRLYHHVICISEGIRQVLLNQGLSKEKVSTVHSAVDLDVYQTGGDRAWLEKQFNLPNDAVLMAIVAQLIPRKGHKMLLNCMDALIDRHPNLHLLIFGKGPLQETITRQISTLMHRSQIQYCGFRDDLPRILPCLDLLIHPASMEGLGVSLLQAAACAVPIIATPVGGIPEIVKHQHNGLLVEPANEKNLSDAISRLLDNTELRQQYGLAGRQLVEQGFSINSMVQGNQKIYGTLIQCRE